MAFSRVKEFAKPIIPQSFSTSPMSEMTSSVILTDYSWRKGVVFNIYLVWWHIHKLGILGICSIWRNRFSLFQTLNSFWHVGQKRITIPIYEVWIVVHFIKKLKYVFLDGTIYMIPTITPITFYTLCSPISFSHITQEKNTTHQGNKSCFLFRSQVKYLCS